MSQQVKITTDGMKLSSSSFIHYTSKIEAVESILERGFNVYYCLEEVYCSGDIKHIGIPMVSFCDIPLVHVAANNYGHYAFGMSRSWGIRQHLLPVSYYPNNKGCLSTLVVKRASAAYIDNKGDFEILGYSKPMYKLQNQSKRKNNNYKEREWRKVYAPNSSYKWKSESEYREYRGDEDTDKKKVGKPLKFNVKDIDFILVPDIDVSSIVSCIKKLKHVGGNSGKQLSEGDKDLLLAKILSYDNLIKNL